MFGVNLVLLKNVIGFLVNLITNNYVYVAMNKPLEHNAGRFNYILISE